MINSYNIENTVRKTFLILLAALLASLVMTIGLAPARAALPAGGTGPVDPDNGFPIWYQDGATRLDLCLDPNNAMCVAPPDNVDPNSPISFPDNFPEEAFWWSGDATMPTNGGGNADLIQSFEAAFSGGPPKEGDQSSFGRIRIRVDNLVIGEEYKVTYPYGTETFVAEDNAKGNGEINVTRDVGCFGSAAAPCKFDQRDAALSSKIGPFLTWDTYNSDPAASDPLLTDANGDTYVGDAVTPHAVVGSPLTDASGDPQNYFKVEGPDVGGPGVDVVQTDLFTIAGKVATPQARASLRDSIYNTPKSVELMKSDSSYDVYFTETSSSDGTEPAEPPDPTVAPENLYSAPIDIGEASAVQIVKLKFMAVDPATGKAGPIQSRTYTIDTVAPNVSATPDPGTYEQAQDVTLKASEPADIFYTTDGSDPSDAGNQAREKISYDPASTDPPQTITVSRSQKIRAVAVDQAGGKSKVETFNYTISALAKTGPINPQGGFPFWYEDRNGTRLGLCLDPQDQKCLQPFPMPDPTAEKVSFPDNFPEEAFWWSGQADLTLPGAKRATLVMSQEAAFTNGLPAADEQDSFGRIRIRIDGLVAGQKYRVSHPYGTDTYVAEDDKKGGGRINVTEDIGCFGLAATPCKDNSGFDATRFGRVGPFLTWNTFGNGMDDDPATEPDPALMGLDANGQPDPNQPDRYVGDPTIEAGHTVTGSPIPDANDPSGFQNYFKLERIDTNGSATELASTRDFIISGKVAKLEAGASKAGGFYNAPLTGANAVELVSSAGPDDPATTIYYTINGGDPTTSSDVYSGPIPISAMNAVTTLKYMAADASGNQSQVYTEVYTLDNRPPQVSAVSDPQPNDTRPDGTKVFNDVFPTITLNSSDELSGPAKVYYTLDGTDPVPGGRKSTLYTDPIKLAKTNTTLKFLAVDKANNVSSPISTEKYAVVDATPPTTPTLNLDAASDTGASSTDNITSATTPKFTGKAEAGSTVEVLDGATSLGTATADIGAADASGDKGWELTVPADRALGEGDRNITATATDEAGNVSDPPASLSITVDTRNPVVSASVDSGTYPRTQTVRLTSSEPATIYYTLNGRAPVVGAAGTVKGNTATVSTSGTLRFMAIDTAGNQSAVGSRVYRIQNARPVISNIGPTGRIADRTPRIVATVNDSDSNLREANITLVVDGRNIPRANFTYSAATNRMIYQSPRLGLGRHTVRLTARDVDGGVTSRNWSFRIR